LARVEKKETKGKRRHAVKKSAAILILVVMALAMVALISLKVYAAAPGKPVPQVWNPGCVASVPRAWGTFKGGSAQSGLAFEDSAGTLRFLTNIPCDGTPVVALEIRRTQATSPNGANP
jgi:hypothetical protein